MQEHHLYFEASFGYTVSSRAALGTVRYSVSTPSHPQTKEISSEKFHWQIHSYILQEDCILLKIAEKPKA